MIIILHVNDRVESKFSKLSSKVSNFETFENFKILQLLSLRRTSSKQNLFGNNSQNEAILISNDFIVPQLHLPRQKCVENVSPDNSI